MTDTNRVSLAYVKEVTWGTNPGGTLQKLRFTGESLRQATRTTTSTEIRDDRRTVDVLRTGVNAEGDVNIELSGLSYDDLWEGVLQSAAKTASATVNSVDFTLASVTGNEGTITRAAGDWTSGTAFTVGRFVKLTGFTAGLVTANGYWKITAVTTTVLTVVGYKAMPAGTETGGAGVIVRMLPYLQEGTTVSSYTIEKAYNAVSKYAIYTGMMPSGFSLSCGADQIITGSFSFLGSKEESSNSSAGSGYTAATTNPVFSGIDSVVAVTVEDVAYTIVGFTMQAQNNLRPRQECGSASAISIGSGSFLLTGSIRFYFANSTLIDKFLAFTQSSVKIFLNDASGRVLILDMPSIKFTSGQRVAGGQNSDVIAEMQFTSIYTTAGAKMLGLTTGL